MDANQKLLDYRDALCWTDAVQCGDPHGFSEERCRQLAEVRLAAGLSERPRPPVGPAPSLVADRTNRQVEAALRQQAEAREPGRLGYQWPHGFVPYPGEACGLSFEAWAQREAAAARRGTHVSDDPSKRSLFEHEAVLREFSPSTHGSAAREAYMREHGLTFAEGVLHWAKDLEPLPTPEEANRKTSGRQPDSERKALEAVKVAKDALETAGRWLADALKPLAAVEAERDGSGPNVIISALDARADVARAIRRMEGLVDYGLAVVPERYPGADYQHLVAYAKQRGMDRGAVAPDDHSQHVTAYRQHAGSARGLSDAEHRELVGELTAHMRDHETMSDRARAVDESLASGALQPRER